MLDLNKETGISKTKLKKDSKNIQELGNKISKLSINKIELFKFSPNIFDAIINLKKIKSNSAKKRQIQYLGKLLREIDLSNAFLTMENLKVSSQREVKRNHIAEKWRDELLKKNDSITKFINQYPDIDKQSLRQTIVNAQKENLNNSQPKYSRQLYKIIKDIIVKDLD